MSTLEDALTLLGNTGSNAQNLELLISVSDQLVPFVGAGLSIEFDYPAWGALLRELGQEAGVLAEVESHLDKGEYEEAAEAAATLKNSFDDKVRLRFDHRLLRRPLDKGAVRQIPRIARGPVLTTNFDRVLESAFTDSGKEFLDFFVGSRIEPSRAIQLRERVLLKLHGDYRQPGTRILTFSEYVRAYGSPDPKSVDLELPLPKAIGQALVSAPILFLGCSLKNDRTTRVISEIARRFGGTTHFALLSASENSLVRRKRFDDWNIRPVFFPKGQHQKIGEFLKLLGDYTSRLPVAALPAPRNPTVGRINMAKKPPASFVARPAEFADSKRRLLNRSTVALSTGLAGAGGYGKTTLAQAICADREIQAAFSGGILWVDIGQTPNILGELDHLYRVLTGSAVPTTAEKEASELIAKILEGRPALIVIDDVWRTEHLKPFLDAAPNGVRLITTRLPGILDEFTELVRVDEMDEVQAIQLLLSGIAERPKDDHLLHDLTRQLGYWALLLELANARLRAELKRRGASVEEALKFVIEEYRSHGLTAFDRKNQSQRNDAAAKSIELSLEFLDSEDRNRFLDLGIFPEDTSIPRAVAAELWGLDTIDAEETLRRLDDLSLVKYFASQRTFRLHDVLYDWLRRQIAHRLAQTHAKLVAAWGPPLAIPQENTYAWRWMIWHMANAGQRSELKSLLLNAAWIDAKVACVGLDSLTSDYDHASPSKPHHLVQRALLQSSHVIFADPKQLYSQLYGRLVSIPEPGLDAFRAVLSNSVPLIPLSPGLVRADTPLLSSLDGHSAGVMSVAFSANGKTLASGSADKTIKLWDVATPGRARLLSSLDGHSAAVRSVAFSADGKTLASGSDDKTIKLWDVATPGRARLLSSLDGHSDWVMSVAFSADGKTLASGSADKTIKLWDVATPERARLLSSLHRHSAGVRSVVFSADGKTFASGSADMTIKLWDVATPGRAQLLSSLDGHSAGVVSLDFSRDGKTLASGSVDTTVKLWDVATPGRVRLLSSLDGHSAWVRSVAFSADGKTLASGSVDKTIKLWDVVTPGRAGLLSSLDGHSSGVMSVAFSADGKTLASGSGAADKTIKLWDVATPGRLLSSLDGHSAWVRSVAFSADGKTLASGFSDKTIKLWDVATPERLLSSLDGHSDWVMSVAFSADGKTLASGSADTTIKLWDVATPGCARLLSSVHRHSAGVRSVVFSADGKILASGSDDTTIKLCDVATPGRARLLSSLDGHSDRVLSVAFSADGKTLASGSADKTIKLWDVAAPGRARLLYSLDDHSAGVMSVAFSADGKTLASGSDDTTIKLWDVATPGHARLLSSLDGHSDWVMSVAFSADGKTLASGSTDRTIKLWDVAAPGPCLTTFTADAPLLCLAVSPYFHHLAAGDSIGNIHLLRIHRRG